MTPVSVVVARIRRRFTALVVFGILIAWTTTGACVLPGAQVRASISRDFSVTWVENIPGLFTRIRDGLTFQCPPLTVLGAAGKVTPTKAFAMVCSITVVDALVQHVGVVLARVSFASLWNALTRGGISVGTEVG